MGLVNPHFDRSGGKSSRGRLGTGFLIEGSEVRVPGLRQSRQGLHGVYRDQLLLAINRVNVCLQFSLPQLADAAA